MRVTGICRTGKWRTTTKKRWGRECRTRNGGQHRNGVNSRTGQWETEIWRIKKCRTAKWRIGKWLTIMEMTNWTIS